MELLCIDCIGAVAELVFDHEGREAGFCRSCANAYPSHDAMLRRYRLWADKQLAAEATIARAGGAA